MKRPWLLLPFFALVLQTSWGQAPSGPVSLFFGNRSTLVYDLSGTYTFNQEILANNGTSEPLSITDVVLQHERSGRLHGKGYILVAIGADSAVAARYVANGHVSGGGGKDTKVQLTITLTGRDVVAGIDTSFNIQVRYNLVVDPDMLMLVGTAKGHANFSKLSGGKINTDGFTLGLPAGMDGTWVAQLNLVSFNKLGGSGGLVLSNGRTIPVKASGTYFNTGLSKVRLAGQKADDGGGNSVQVGFFTGVGLPDTANGMILGQKVLQ